MGLMTYIHRLLLKRGLLSDILPEDVIGDMPKEATIVKAEIEARAAEESEIQKEVAAAVKRLEELDRRNHYGESLRKAFGGR